MFGFYRGLILCRGINITQVSKQHHPSYYGHNVAFNVIFILGFLVDKDFGLATCQVWLPTGLTLIATKLRNLPTGVLDVIMLWFGHYTGADITFVRKFV